MINRLTLLVCAVVLSGCVAPKPSAPLKTNSITPPSITVSRMANVTSSPLVVTQALGTKWTWQHNDFTPIELTTFRFYGRSNLSSPWVLLGTNTKPVWTHWFSNGPMQFIGCVALDRDMPKDSSGRPR